MKTTTPSARPEHESSSEPPSSTTGSMHADAKAESIHDRSALHEDLSRVHTLRQWTTFAAVFAAGVILLLMLDALLNGSTAHMLEVTGVTSGFVLLWYLAFRYRMHWPRTTNFIRYLAPIMLYPAMYGMIHAMITAGRPSDLFLIDHVLLDIDVTMFGLNPIAWLGEHQQPLLTDALHLAYFSYYFGMPVLMILMFRNSAIPDFRRALGAMTIGWYGALITYTLFPALGPNRWMPDQLPVLQGWLPTTAWIQAFLAANLAPAVRDCIPSMHTGVTLLTLMYAFRFQRIFFWIFLLPGLGIIAATMYIQAHYVIDVVLGFIAAGMIYVLVERYKPV
ncbi:MAG: phosphatase PAP2 family protein [Bacteroidetes bacterium]|nr:phosphatase PAP2 family protein [Bacteroidota bacterium]